MREVNVTELRSHLPKYLLSIQKGEEVLVTSHGKVIARILPPIDTQGEAIKKLKQLRQHCKVGDVVSSIKAEWDADK